MRLFGSLNNRIAEDVLSAVPAVGMGATILMYSDRHACTVIEVKSPSRIVIQEDAATRADANGMSDSQSYTFAANPAGATHVVSKRSDGRWKIAKSGTVVMMGERDHHYDYGF